MEKIVKIVYIIWNSLWQTTGDTGDKIICFPDLLLLMEYLWNGKTFQTKAQNPYYVGVYGLSFRRK
jgi:hypothetical protein